MSNQFPNKLITLRKHFNYSQQDIAEIMGVPVSEYMKWENGSKLCTMPQLLRLANTFKVSLDELFDNSIEIKLPELRIEDSIEIPFQASMQNTAKIPIIDEYTSEIFPKDENIGQTSGLDKTIVTRIISDNTLEVIEPEETVVIKKPRVIQEVKKEDDLKKRKDLKVPLIVISILGILLLVVGGFYFIKNTSKKNINEIASINRLETAKEYSLYLASEGNIVSHGNNPSIKDFKDVIQISTNNNMIFGLNKDGTVVCAGNNCYVTGWKKIKMISASNSHVLGLKEDGTVLCDGNNCNVDSWKDVSFVHASDDGSFGISGGKLLYSGTLNIETKLQSLNGIKSLTTSSNYLVALTNSNQVEVISLRNQEGLITNTWNNVSQIAAGSDFVAGLNSNGTVSIVGNEAIAKEVAKWNNIKYIAAYENYIIGINNNNLMLGAGDNTYGQYENNEVTPSPSEDAVVKLSKVGNVKLSENNKVLSISWDPVENADYYQVSLNVPGNYTVKTQTNSLTIDSSKLTSNTNYMISIVSNSNDTKKFEPSDVFVVNYQYIGATPTPVITQHSVIFYDYDGKTVLSEQKVDDGANAVAPSDPIREGYTFMGWKGDYFNITKDTKIYATYDKKQVKTYKITFKDYDGSNITSMTLDEGSAVNPPNMIDKTNSKFTGWNPKIEAIAARDITYTAIYACTIKDSNGNLFTPDASGNCNCPSGTSLSGDTCIVNPQPTVTPTTSPTP